jgi:hypothetical protein
VEEEDADDIGLAESELQSASVELSWVVSATGLVVAGSLPVYAFALPGGMADSTPNSEYRIGSDDPSCCVPSNACPSVVVRRL